MATPVLATHAHLFQIDPQTKRNWKPLSSESVPLSIIRDRSEFRILSVDASKQPVLQSLLLPTSTFIKTSPKFGQWADSKALTVFGLGFAQEADLNLVTLTPPYQFHIVPKTNTLQFVEKFDESVREIKELVSASAASPPLNIATTEPTM